jgi:hypothetical protein
MMPFNLLVILYIIIHECPTNYLIITKCPNSDLDENTNTCWWFGTMEFGLTFHLVGNTKSSKLTFTHIFFWGIGPPPSSWD